MAPALAVLAVGVQIWALVRAPFPERQEKQERRL